MKPGKKHGGYQKFITNSQIWRPEYTVLCSKNKSKQLGNYTLNIMKKIPGNLLKKPVKIMEISWNFVSPEKWEP